MLTNKEIAKQFKLCADLMDLHGENAFKVKAYANASFQIGKYDSTLAEMSVDDIAKAPGVGKKLATQVQSCALEGSFEDLENLLTATPTGVLDMLSIKGLGSSKVKSLWKEHQIEDVEALFQACQHGVLAQIKGFGDKTQQNILEAIVFKKQQEKKVLYSQALAWFQAMQELLKLKDVLLWPAGDFLRKEDVLDRMELLLISTPFTSDLKQQLQHLAGDFELVFHEVSSEEEVGLKQWSLSASDNLKPFYDQAKTLALPPERWHDMACLEVAKAISPSLLVEVSDLKGALHNHSKYSDGQNTLEEMIQGCINLGYIYFGIADHSQSATYAGGLKEADIIMQHQEIDALRLKYPHFTIFKGIESDILRDGRLDYSEDILKTFDYVVASVHSVLNMNKEQATTRLLKAIENPFTTILGHPSGRLLLKRPGYDLDYDKIFDACVANKVVVEINANPWRLDLDWRHISKAQDKGCLFAVNPDAHKVEALTDMQYGVFSARKGGLLKERVINTFDVQRLWEVFRKKNKNS